MRGGVNMAASATTTALCFFLKQPPPMLFTLSLLSFFILISSLFYYYYHYTTTTIQDHVFIDHATDIDVVVDDDKLSPKWASLILGDGDDPGADGSGMDNEVVESECGKKKKKRAKKKKKNKGGVKVEEQVEKEKKQVVSLYPFTTSSSAMQRKIKLHYDQILKSHDSNGLTLAQVGHFVKVLTEARNELQHKSGIIQRKYTTTKALLSKADRSSFDRLRQQTYKLEIEQKRLEEDVSVYNWLQQQLKLSPAFKRMLEIGARMELKAKTAELDYKDTKFADISFEELLAKEKKDSFWQKKGRPKSCTG